MALRNLIVSPAQASAMRAIYRALIDKSGLPFADVLRDRIAEEIERRLR